MPGDSGPTVQLWGQTPIPSMDLDHSSHPISSITPNEYEKVTCENANLSHCIEELQAQVEQLAHMKTPPQSYQVTTQEQPDVQHIISTITTAVLQTLQQQQISNTHNTETTQNEPTAQSSVADMSLDSENIHHDDI